MGRKTIGDLLLEAFVMPFVVYGVTRVQETKKHSEPEYVKSEVVEK